MSLQSSNVRPTCFKDLLSFWKTFVIFILPLVFLPLPLLGGDDKFKVAYVVAIMASFWVLEVLPLPVTALLPVVMFPLMGIMSTSDVTANYLTATTMNFFASLVIAVAVEESGLLNRLALFTLSYCGSSDRLLLLGFMVPTAFCSMWISDTATTAMMVKTVQAVLNETRQETQPDYSGSETESSYGTFTDLRKGIIVSEISSMSDGEQKASNSNLATFSSKISCHSHENLTKCKSLKCQKEVFQKRKEMLMMCISMSALCGGTGSTIGTSPNIVMVQIFNSSFPNSPLSFASWLAFAVPQLIICVLVLWIWLQIYYLPTPWKKTGDEEKHVAERKDSLQKAIGTHFKELGPMSYEEKTLMMCFLFLSILWFFRSPGFVTGWGDYIESNNRIEHSGEVLSIADATPAVLVMILLFILPKEPRYLKLLERKSLNDGNEHEALTTSPSILHWRLVETKLSWGVLFLIGGGFALADGFSVSGLSDYIGGKIQSLPIQSETTLVFVIGAIMCCFAQILTNSAVASLFIPILIAICQEGCINPLRLCLPAVFICSFSFMLPFTTPANAIAYEASGMKTMDMIKVGWIMNIAMTLITIGCTNTYGVLLFDLSRYPEWAMSGVNDTCLYNNATSQ